MNSIVSGLILILTLFFLTGCGNPGFTEQGSEGPVWHNQLNSEVDRKGKVQNPSGEGNKAQQRQPDHPDEPGDVVAQPPPPVAEAAEDAPPEWVEDLKKEVETENVGKQSKKRQSVKVAVTEDLIVEANPKPEAPVLAPAPGKPQPPKKVDIVFIVDTSRSMSAFLRNVEKSFENFIPALSSLDWRIFFH